MQTLVGKQRLPTFTEKEQKQLKQSIDFLGLNHYSTKYYLHRYDGGIAENEGRVNQALTRINLTDTFASYHSHPEGGWNEDQMNFETKYKLIDGELIGEQGASSWLNNVPWGFYKLLLYMKDHYHFQKDTTEEYAAEGSNKAWIYITENGCDAPNESSLSLPEVLQDDYRIRYLAAYLAQLDKAISQGVPIMGYYAWSLLDNFVWADGYEKRFGLHYVDYHSAERTRYAKASAVWYHDYLVAHRESYPGKSRVVVPIHSPGKIGESDSSNNEDKGKGEEEVVEEEKDEEVEELACAKASSSSSSSCHWYDYWLGAMRVQAKTAIATYMNHPFAP